jgi:arylsulfatase B
MNYRRSNSGLATRLGRASLILSLAAFGAAGATAGCASEPGSPGQEDGDHIGSLGLNLNVAPGVTINEVTYTITGNGFTKTGTIDASGAPTISATIGGIPAGTGYSIALTATSAEGNTTFTGSAKFEVTAGGSASVTVRLRGTSTGGNGSVTVNGTINVNPVIDELSVSPLTVYVGSSITLSAVGRDPDEGPAPLTYYWSASQGVVDDPIAASTTLASANPGTATVTLTVSDGDGAASATRTVTFVKPREADGGADGGADAGPSKPNVLLIIADDLGAASTSLYPDLAGDSGTVPIPNIEALAQNGLVFDNAWASPVCSPTRGTIVSGQYGHRTGVTNVGDVLPISTTSLFDRLTTDSTDYSHAFFGKYHVGGGTIDPVPGAPYPFVAQVLQHARDIGITTFRGILGGAVADYFNWTTYDINAIEFANQTYATTALTDYAIEHIHQQERANPDKPWFVYQAYNAPHAANGGNAPYQVPPANLHSVDLSAVGTPEVGALATNIPIYKADIQALDTEIGRLLKEIDFEQTTVIFVGDNGVPPPVTDVGQGLRGSKGSVYEGGVRVPLVVAGAGVTRRGREDNLFVTTDIYATVLNLTGANVSQVNDSYSLKPLLSDESASSARTHSYSESGRNQNHQYAIRDSRFKLLKNSTGWALYDLGTDPLETTNLYASANYAAARASLQTELDKLKTGAAAPFFQ